MCKNISLTGIFFSGSGRKKTKTLQPQVLRNKQMFYSAECSELKIFQLSAQHFKRASSICNRQRVPNELVQLKLNLHLQNKSFVLL